MPPTNSPPMPAGVIQEIQHHLAAIQRLAAQLPEPSRAATLSALIALTTVQEQQQHHDRLLATIIEASPQAIICTDTAYHVTLWNPAAEALFGWLADDVLGQPCPITPAEDLSDAGCTSATYELQVYRQDGALLDVLVATAPFYNALGGLTGTVNIITDITRRKLAEDELTASEGRFRAIFESARDAIYIKNLDRVYTHVNRAVEQHNQRPAAEIIGLTDREMFGDEMDAVIAPIDRRVLAGEVIEQELTKVMCGVTYVFHTHKMPLRNREGEIVGLCGIARDISERARAQQQRLDLALERERVKVLNAFIQSASHEFSTPLSIINTNLYMLAHTDHTPQAGGPITTIKQQVHHIDRLVKAILTMSRLDSSSPFVTATECISGVVHDACVHVAPALEANNITLNQEIAPDLFPIDADPYYLHEALVHLLTNAVQHTPPGGTITVRAHPDSDGWVRLTIQDTGTGINPHDLPHVFDRFFRADRAHTVRGVGLGLAITKKIIEGHGGSITLESAPGEGTAVTVCLPASGPDNPCL